jgi:hypothetical protein
VGLFLLKIWDAAGPQLSGSHRKMASRLKDFIFQAVCLSVFVGSLAVISEAYWSVNLPDHGVRTASTIMQKVDISDQWRFGRKGWCQKYVIYEYSLPNGAQFQDTLCLSSTQFEKMRVGGKLDIVYLENNPGQNRMDWIDDWHRQYYIAARPYAVLALAGLAGVFLLMLIRHIYSLRVTSTNGSRNSPSA